MDLLLNVGYPINLLLLLNKMVGITNVCDCFPSLTNLLVNCSWSLIAWCICCCVSCRLVEKLQGETCETSALGTMK